MLSSIRNQHPHVFPTIFTWFLANLSHLLKSVRIEGKLMAAEEFKSDIIGKQANVLAFVYTVAETFSGDGFAKSLIPITT
ncbi:hypothetical protein Hanom_Chr14g01247851 [Helianthus anomalus]